MAAYYHHYGQMNDFMLGSGAGQIDGDADAAIIKPDNHAENLAYQQLAPNGTTGQPPMSAGIDSALDSPAVIPTYLPHQLYCNTIIPQSQSGYYGQALEPHMEPVSALNAAYLPCEPCPVSQRKSYRSRQSRRDQETGEAKPAKIRKRHVPSPGISELVDRVFVWDLDETAIIFQSLLTGAFARKYGKDIQTCVALGLEMEELIFYLADNFLFLKDLEDCDQVHIDELSAEDTGQDLSSYDFANDGLNTMCSRTGNGAPPTFKGSSEWLKKLAFRYRRVKEIFLSCQTSLQAFLADGRYERWLRLRCEMESFTDGWTTLSSQCLSLIARRQECVNVLVTSSHLVPAIAKLMLFGLADTFDADAVYSAAKVGKEACFDRIANRFGRKITFVVIGDGPEEESAAKQLNWPYWRVATHSDLVALHHALDMEFL